MARFFPIAVARLPSIQDLRGFYDHDNTGRGNKSPAKNTLVTLYGPLDGFYKPHPAAVVAQKQLNAVMAKAAEHPDVTATQFAEALAAAHADGTDTQLLTFARRWLAAARMYRAAGKVFHYAQQKHAPNTYEAVKADMLGYERDLRYYEESKAAMRKAAST